MKKNTKIILAVGAVGVAAYLILRKKKSGMTNFTGYSYATGAVTVGKTKDCASLKKQYDQLLAMHNAARFCQDNTGVHVKGYLPDGWTYTSLHNQLVSVVNALNGCGGNVSFAVPMPAMARAGTSC